MSEIKAGGKDILPLNNIDYLINVGIKLQESLGETAILEASHENIANAIEQYFAILKSSLEDYDKVWETRFSSNPLVKKIADKEFLRMLSYSISCLAGEEED